MVSKETILKSDTLLSLGINDDWSFEKHFKKINSEARIFCYDDKPILKYLCKKMIIDVGKLFLLVKPFKLITLLNYLDSINNTENLHNSNKYLTDHIIFSPYKKTISIVSSFD